MAPPTSSISFNYFQIVHFSPGLLKFIFPLLYCPPRSSLLEFGPSIYLLAVWLFGVGPAVLSTTLPSAGSAYMKGYRMKTLTVAPSVTLTSVVSLWIIRIC
ncbi:hypothetical protein RND81_03G106400 [Saponaria officinalis]|uniref:Uncharacterized protein n=1 Tax=Saponaria officinalis TaxID=3572 RepID=A0AAW1M592_SAPOF